jgi:hypothetical protein
LLALFREHLRKRSATAGQSLDGASLVAVVQGYGDGVAEAGVQRDLIEGAGVARLVVLRSAIEQSWHPIVR